MNFPPIPEVPADDEATARLPIRYEDVVQDGRLVLEALPTAFGQTVWRKLVAKHPVAAKMREGVIPILSRMVCEGYRGPLAVGSDVTARGVMQLAHSQSESGEVERIVLNMWAEVSAPMGHTHGPPPPEAGRVVVMGRIFGEHVFTRPFVAGDRRVRRLELEGVPPVPPTRYDPSPLPSLLDLPAGAAPLDPELTLDPTPLALGVCHTDSNQHVNSLVYPRLFEEAALRRFAALGRGTAGLARELEIGYRKPAFAGQTLRVAVRAFELGGRRGAVGVFVHDEDARAGNALARPHAFVRMLFEP